MKVSGDDPIYLSVPANFDFDQCLRFLDRNPHEILHRVENGRWIKLIELAKTPVIIQVSKVSEHLCVKALNTELDQEQRITLVSFLEEVFDLNSDLTAFYQKMRGDPIMGDLCEEYQGLRLLGIPDLFEALCWCIIGQQINLNFAYKLKQRLVQATGDKLHYMGRDYFMFPRAEVVANMSVKEFSHWQFSAAKASYLIGVAEQIQAGALTKSGLLGKSVGHIEQTLMGLKGIGTWSAQYVMMKCLRIGAAFPVHDVGLQNAIKVITDSPKKPSLAQLHQLNRKWHPWQAYATFYLWHSLIK